MGKITCLASHGVQLLTPHDPTERTKEDKRCVFNKKIQLTTCLIDYPKNLELFHKFLQDDERVMQHEGYH